MQNICGHHGGEQARHHQREKHGDRRCPAKLHKKLACNATHESGRQKNGNQGKGRGNHCQTNFVGGVHGRLIRGFALTQVTHDVFDFHNRVIHQNAHHQG